MSSPPTANSGGKKKIAAVGVSSLLLLAVAGVVATVAIRSNSSKNSSGGTQTSVRTVESLCHATDYQQQCVDNLKPEVGDTADTNEIVKAAFRVTINHIREAFNHSQTIQAAADDNRTSQALNNCRELFDYAIGDLERSIDQVDVFSMSRIDKIVEDLKVWVSAVVTYEETCLDGFENTTGDAAEKMRAALNSSMELTSNALAIIDEVASVVDDFDIPSFFSRRLLSVDEDMTRPSWVHERKLFDITDRNVKPNLTVAQDGSGDFKTITEALEKVPEKKEERFVIYVKEGVYKEQATVGKSLTNVMMYGDGPDKTRITGNLNFIDGVGTFNSASFIVIGDGFMARDMGFENTAGAIKHQAVAIRVQSDRSVFFNCHFDGYQDTLYAHTHRQFYRDCTISGTIDFVFGDAACVFQNCKFVVRKPMDSQQTIVTAQGRKERREASGIVIHNCTISAADDYAPSGDKMKAFLGRPWKMFSRTLIMQTNIDGFINSDGWMPWQGDFALKTCLYGEFDNRGPGADMSKRVTWKGIKKIDYQHALKYSVEYFMGGNDWLPATGVPYVAGLLPLSEEGRNH